MTVSEAAKRIGISVSKLYQLASARRIAHYRIGGKIVFTEADIDAFLQACRVGATAGDVQIAPPLPPGRSVLKHLSVRNR